MDMSDIWKLAQLLRQNGDKVLNDGCKLALTVPLLQKLNDAFLVIVEHEESRGGFQVVSSNSEHDELFYDLHFLHDFVQKVVALRIEQNTPSRVPATRNSNVNVGKFKSLKYLELKKIPIHNVTGLQAFRSQLQAIVCFQCVRKLEDVLCSCGGDQSSDFSWGELREAVFSYNSISELDGSLSLAPWLQILDLSHNRLTSADGLQHLLCLRYLNIGYNSLTSVPVLNKEACSKLQILVLKNNFIEGTAGLDALESLVELDMSCNFVTRLDSLRVLGRMPALSVVHLEGNPLCFYPEYRVCVAGMLHPNTVVNEFVLDGELLTRLEVANLGNAAKCEEVVIPLSLPVMRDGVEGTSLPVSTPRPARGKKATRVREAVISEQLGAEEVKKPLSASPTSSVDLQQSGVHLETKKQVEMLREVYGEDDWLHHLGGSRLQDVLGMERTAPPDLGETLQRCLGTSEGVPETGVPASSVPEVRLVSDGAVVVPETNAGEEAATEWTALVEDETSAEVPQAGPEAEPSEETPLGEAPLEEADDDVADVKLYLVQKRRPGVDILDEMFLVVMDSHMKEREMVSGKTKEKWALETLLSCTKTLNDPVTVHLTFDTVRRDRQERFYIMDEEDADQLVRLLGGMLASRSLAAMNQVVFRCLRCQSEFTQETSGHAAAPAGSRSVGCPTCGSPVVIIADEDPLPSNASMSAPPARRDEPGPAGQESGVLFMTKCPSQCSIGSRMNVGTGATDAAAAVHGPNPEVDCIRPEAPSRSATSLNQSPERFHDGISALRQYESDIEILSNPSQSSIEVLDENGRIRGGTPARKSSSEEKEMVAVVPQLSSVKAIIMTESSSSGSLTDSVCTAYENNEARVSTASSEMGASSARAAVAGSGLPRAPTTSESSDDTLEGMETQAPAPGVGAAPEIGVTYTSVLEGLLQSVNSRIPPASAPRTPRQASGGSIRYSYVDFSDVDHRVKLHLYVHVFGDQEQLVLLLKARIVRYRSDVPFVGCLVFSTSKIYVLQITGPESEEPQDWLRLEECWPAESLRCVSLLPSEQGVVLEMGPGPVACLLAAVMQHASRTTCFTEFLSGLSLPDRYDFAICGTSDRSLLLIQQLMLSMPMDEELDLALNHFVIFSHCVVTRGEKDTRSLRIGALLLTDTALLLTDESVDWLFPGDSGSPSPCFVQNLSNLTELETEGLCLTLHFFEESTEGEESWVVAVDSREMGDALTESVRSLWEDLFSVPLQVVDKGRSGGS